MTGRCSECGGILDWPSVMVVRRPTPAWAIEGARGATGVLARAGGTWLRSLLAAPLVDLAFCDDGDDRRRRGIVVGTTLVLVALHVAAVGAAMYLGRMEAASVLGSVTALAVLVALHPTFFSYGLGQVGLPGDTFARLRVRLWCLSPWAYLVPAVPLAVFAEVPWAGLLVGLAMPWLFLHAVASIFLVHRQVHRTAGAPWGIGTACLCAVFAVGAALVCGIGAGVVTAALMRGMEYVVW